MQVAKKLIFIIIMLAGMIKVWDYVEGKIETPPGYCKEKNKYFNNNDLIDMALTSYGNTIKNYNENKETPQTYYRKNKECCRVIRSDAKLINKILFNEENSIFHVDIVFEVINELNNEKKIYNHVYLKYNTCGKLIDRIES